MRRAVSAVAAIGLLVGVFWSGRESTHGLHAMYEHWWCPIPLVLTVMGLAVLAVSRRGPATA